jgi:hypothetical protein
VLGGSGLAANPYIVGKDLGTGEEGWEKKVLFLWKPLWF